jgi:phenylalanyl-tRNA synthetase beta chain
MQAIPERREIEPISAFPPVLEDIAVVVDEDLAADRLQAAILRAGSPLVKEVRLFDLYQGTQIGEGMKSLAYSIVYQAADRTLTDAEVANVRNEIVDFLASEFGAKLRD